MSDKEVFVEMLQSAGCVHSFEDEWNAVRVHSSTAGGYMWFLFDENGSMYSGADEKALAWRESHTVVREPALAVSVDEDGKHYVYEPEAEPERWARQRRRESKK